MPTQIVRNGTTWRREKCHTEPVRGQKCRSTRRAWLLEDPMPKLKTASPSRWFEDDDEPTVDEDDATSICSSSDTESLHELEFNWELNHDDDMTWC